MLQKLQSGAHGGAELGNRLRTIAKASQSLNRRIGHTAESISFEKDHPAPHSLCVLGSHCVGFQGSCQLTMQLLPAAFGVSNKHEALLEGSSVDLQSKRLEFVIERFAFVAFCRVGQSKQIEQGFARPAAAAFQLAPREQGIVIIESTPKQP